MSRISFSTLTFKLSHGRRLSHVLIAVASAALVAHIGWSAMVVGLLDNFYDHRIFNLRKAKNPGRDWEAMSAAFLHQVLEDTTKNKRPAVLFLGSSFTYGYPWQEPIIFSSMAAKRLPDWRVANLSLIGGDIAGILGFTTCALGGDIKPDVLIAEIPLVNSIAQLTPNTPVSIRQCTSSGEHTDYWGLVLTRPYGLGWLSLLWDEEAYNKPDSNIQIEKLPSSYFATEQRFIDIKPQFALLVKDYVERLSSAANKVIVYVSPVYIAGIKEAGGDGAAVEKQIEFAYSICKENAKVTCIDPSSIQLGREMFYNLTHLNQRGHRALGEYFAQKISTY